MEKRDRRCENFQLNQTKWIRHLGKSRLATDFNWL
jgi:hypothetical protein